MYLMRFTIRVGQGRGGADIFDLLILRCSDWQYSGTPVHG